MNEDTQTRPVEAVLFDLDGTLVDSEPVYWESDRAFLAGYGIDYHGELNAAMVGRGSNEFFREMEALFPASPLNSMSLAERSRRKDEAYLAHARGRLRSFPGVEAFARELRARGIPAAIASGSTPPVIDATLDMLGLGDLFPVRVSGSEVPRGKPEPDVFLEAARRLGTPPAACLVLEDSEPGLMATRAAGMACVALPHPGHPRMGVFSGARLVVTGGAAAFVPSLVFERWAFALKEAARG